MTIKQHEVTDLDDLLRRALADDLPADVEAGMRERIRQFRADTLEEGRRSTARAWLFPRSVWAALSVLMLVAGILLQGLRARNPLAERIVLIKAEFSSSEPARRSDAASEIRMFAPYGGPIHCLFNGEVKL